MHVGIVLFTPQIETLQKNLEILSCSDNIEGIILVDNGSRNIEHIRELIKGNEKIYLIENNDNLGIATALNQMCRYALEVCNANWLLTLDDDSIVSNDLLTSYRIKSTENNPTTAIITCRINDRNVGDMRSNNGTAIQEIDYCITSGSLLNLALWSSLDGFDESMFIDGVDYDYCMRIVAAGYKIIRLNTVSLSHQVGNGKRVRLFGHDLIVLNHSENRLYYIARNYSYIGIKHHKKIKWYGNVLKRIYLVLMYETDKRVKLKSMISGIRDARKGIMGKRQ